MSIDADRRTRRPTLSLALAEAAKVAGRAPSIHDTQPWRWLVDGDTLELYAEPTRQLPVSDPGGRMMVLSCGEALHHARTVLAAQGWRFAVDRLPSLGPPRLLARLTVSGRTQASPAATRFLESIQFPFLNRRPIADAAVDQSRIDTIRAAVEAEQSWLQILPTDDVLDLAITAGVTGGLPIGAGLDDGDVYAILFGTGDTPASWLNAGEALSAAWLTAIQLGLSITPVSAPVELDRTRQILHRLLPELGEPFLVLRLRVADPDPTAPPRTPKPRSAQLVEIVGGNIGS